MKLETAQDSHRAFKRRGNQRHRDREELRRLFQEGSLRVKQFRHAVRLSYSEQDQDNRATGFTFRVDHAS